MLSFIYSNPDRLLSSGVEEGIQWHVLRNKSGYRSGYSLIPKEYSYSEEEIDKWSGRIKIHGGVTYSEQGEDGIWIGFDCSHSWDAPDPELFEDRTLYERIINTYGDYSGTIRTQEYVENECRKLCREIVKLDRDREGSSFWNPENLSYLIY